MDIFQNPPILPMLIGAETKPFDNDDYLFELKFDGVRCVAFLDKKETRLYNRRGIAITPKFPEFANIHKQAKKRCILDGELISLVEDKPSFHAILNRSLAKDKMGIAAGMQKHPALFVVFDIIYFAGKNLCQVPLLQRKAILAKSFTESSLFSQSRFIEQRGTDFFALTKKQGLEGLIAKEINSLYYPGKRTKEWLKIKNLLEHEFVICGYILRVDSVSSLILGQYDASGVLLYRGHVAIGTKRAEYKQIRGHKKAKNPPFSSYPVGENKDAIWLTPTLVCSIKFIEYGENGGLRQPVFQGLRDDKLAAECTVYQ